MFQEQHFLVREENLPLQKNLWVKQCQDSDETFGSASLPGKAFSVDTIGVKRKIILALKIREFACHENR